ncbi:MAG: beta-glucosidase [Candidatus Hermodarchaeia archaeon]
MAAIDVNPGFEKKAFEIVSKLTLEEKFQLLTSPGFRRIYVTKPVKRVGIPSFRTTDGPLGVAYHSSGFKKCTRFPATISVASTWNRGLVRAMGVAIAEEVRAVGRHMLLAPGINIARTPLNGRTFEYFSEDPYLTKELAIPFVQGVQSVGIGACVKHYAANNQETDRRSCNAIIDERTLHEIYLRAFRAVVKEADPWSVMGCYNKVNDVYGCEHKYLIRDILMDRWGFKGFVMSDWFATRPIETTEGCINGGLSLEMPLPNKYKRKRLQKSFKDGKFSIESLDDLVYRFLRVLLMTQSFEQQPGARNSVEHQNLARSIAEEGMVLLKNHGNLLPLSLDEIESIALVGRNLKKKFGRFLYGGSSAVKPPYEITPHEGLKEKLKGKVKILSNVSKADIAIVFAGLNHNKGEDSESSDRAKLELPPEQVKLITETAANNPNTVVVLIAGSPIAMSDWIEKVPVVLDAWYPGMEGGRAIANVLFGDAEPSGRLPITFPEQLSDSPAHSSGEKRHYPGDEEKNVFYDEGIFVGYRWFDETEIEPLFPFGFGLSYTGFEYENVLLSRESVSANDDSFEIQVDVVNIGDRLGADTIQVYSKDIQSSIIRPPQELVGFEKVLLKPTERKTVSIQVLVRDLAFYDVESHDWKIEPGDFELRIGRSSRDIKMKTSISFY